MTGEKTEKATPKRRKEARKEGQVARTPELGAWSALLLFTLALPTLAHREGAALTALFEDALVTIRQPSVDEAFRVLREGAGHAFLSLVVLGAMVMFIGVAAAVAQGGFFVATKAVKPSAKKLNPVSGIKRIFGPQMFWEGAKTLVKSAAVALLVWSAVRTMMPVIGAPTSPELMLSHTSDHALGLVRSVALAGLVMGALDYAWQRRKVGKQTKMSKDDIRQEYKQAEGDPLVKSAIRARQLAAARNRMMADVPTADVVLVNPTHVAVALRYDPESGAPVVVARGAGIVAAKIRELAAEASVPLVRDVPLARALYASTQVGMEIPAELFAAVAQVLAFVISRRTHGQRGGEHRSPRASGELVVPPRPGQRRRARPKNLSGPVSTGR